MDFVGYNYFQECELKEFKEISLKINHYNCYFRVICLLLNVRQLAHKELNDIDNKH